jgi:methionyl-tRNA formyltransferase
MSAASLPENEPCSDCEDRLDSIVLMTCKTVATQLAQILLKARHDLQIHHANGPEEILGMTGAEPANARLLSFGTTSIVPAALLRSFRFGAYNFHPGPPSYPGWAPASFAVYEQAAEFGATVHEMTQQVDRGAIVGVALFPLGDNVEMRQVFATTVACLIKLCTGLAPALVQSPPLPRLDIAWGKRRTTRKMFKEYCALSPDIGQEELQRRIKAFGYGDGYSVPTFEAQGQPVTRTRE